MKPLLSLVSPAGARGRLSILIFHRVLPAPDPLFPDEVDAERFDRMCAWVARWFHVLPLHDAVTRLREQCLPARALAITFDDGYADNAEIATPILQRHGLSATFFIATGFLDGGVMWNDELIEALRRAPSGALDVGACGVPGLGRVDLDDVPSRRQAIDACLSAVKYLSLNERRAVVGKLLAAAGVPSPRGLMMRTAQLIGMQQAGMAIGAHTVHHPILARLSDAEALQEISASKADLEGRLQQRIGLFAYPNGRPTRDYAAATVGLVRAAGFDAAVTTAPGAANASTDLFQIPRFTPWDLSPSRFALRMGRNLLLRPQTLAA
jgi:peptidoglycan/xylan/chitin deacetylase (PgdA/CDA1 family)